MNLTMLSKDDALALATEGLPAGNRDRKATATIPDDVLAIVSALTLGVFAPLAVIPLPQDASEAKATKREAQGTVAAWNRISKRDKLGYSFALRTVTEDGSKRVNLYGGKPDASKGQVEA